MKNQFILNIIQVLLLSTGLVFFSCDKELDCNESTIFPKGKVNFYTLTDGKLTSKAFDNVSVYGLPRESMLYDTVDRVSALSLPLSQTQDQCLFALKTDIGSDTLRFSYTRDLDFISKECGFSMRCTIYKFEFTTHMIDSAQIINPYVPATETENIRLFF